MGHIPSKEASRYPLLVDLQGSKGGVDRMMAVAMTEDNFPSVDHPLFQQFCKLRTDASVLYWFDDETLDAKLKRDGTYTARRRTEIPAAPSAEVLYKHYVQDVTAALQQQQQQHVNSTTGACPIPICLFRLTGGVNSTEIQVPQFQGLGSYHQNHGKSVAEIVAKEQVELVGYLGCRVVAADEDTHSGNNSPTLSVFLDKSLWNEAKSISIFQIGCKCFEHFSQMTAAASGTAPLQPPRWPAELQCRIQDTNLPTLRLIQKISREFQRQDLPPLTLGHTNTTVSIGANPATLLSLFSGLASTVYAESWPGTAFHRRFCVLTQRSLPNEVPPATPFDDIVNEAKRRWSDSNAPVVAAKQESEHIALKAKGLRKSATRGGSNGQQQQTSDSSSNSSSTGLTQSPPQEESHHYSAKQRQGTRQNRGGGAPVLPGIPNLNASVGGPYALPRVVATTQPPQYKASVPAETSQAPATIEPKSVMLPFQTAVNILIPTSTPGTLQAFPIKWSETQTRLKPSSQRSQHPGALLELAEHPTSGSIEVIGVNGPMQFVVPNPCYLSLSPGTPVFVA